MPYFRISSTYVLPSMWQNRFHTHTKQQASHTHTQTFPSVSPSTVLPILHLFQTVPHSVLPMRATYRSLTSDNISSPHESIISIIFSRKHCKYVNSDSLIFTVVTSHVSCGQPHFPCYCGFLPKAACVWRNSTNRPLIRVKYFRQDTKGPTILGIPWYINAILPTASDFFFTTVLIGIQFFSSKKLCRLVNYRPFRGTIFLNFQDQLSPERRVA